MRYFSGFLEACSSLCIVGKGAWVGGRNKQMIFMKAVGKSKMVENELGLVLLRQ